MAKQDSSFGGDAVTAKYNEVSKKYPGLMDLPEEERDAIVSAYYNSRVDTFDNYFGKLLREHIKYRNMDTFNALGNVIRDRWHTVKNNSFLKGIKRRTAEEYDMFNSSRGRYLDENKEPFLQDIRYQQWRNNLPENLKNESVNYDLRGAYKSGAEPVLEDDGLYHLPSRNSQTGQYLKSVFHPSIREAIWNDMMQGYQPQMINGKFGSLFDPYLYKLNNPFSIQQPVFTDTYGDVLSIDEEGNPYTDNRKYSSIELEPVTVFGNRK